MVKAVLYGILLGIVAYALLLWSRITRPFAHSRPPVKSPSRFKSRSSKEPWVQVYETASLEDARLIQARLQEHEVQCLLFEQGKKDILGNAMKGIGIIVPKSAVALAQKTISRLPV